MKWIILTAVVAMAAAKHFHTCPSNLEKSISKCMGQIPDYAGHGGKDPSMFLLMSDLQRTLQLCREDTLASLFDCLNDLYNECAMKKQNARKLGLVMQAKQWESAINLLCKNRGYLQNNLQCEARAMPQFKQCLARETADINQQFISVNNDYGLTASEKLEAKTDLVCLSQVKIQDCLRKPFERHCSQVITDLLLEVLGKFMPPGCTHREPVYSAWDPTAQGPSYRTSNRDHQSPDHRGDNTGRNTHQTLDTEDTAPKHLIENGPDVFIGRVEDDDDDDDDSEDVADDDERDIFGGNQGRHGARHGNPNGRRQSIFQGPGAAAQAKESDKDGATGVHAATFQIGVLLSVAVSTLTLAAWRMD